MATITTKSLNARWSECLKKQAAEFARFERLFEKTIRGFNALIKSRNRLKRYKRVSEQYEAEVLNTSKGKAKASPRPC